ELAQVFGNAQARGIIYDEAAQPAVAQLLAGFDLALCIGNGPGSQRLTRWQHEPQQALPLPQPQWPAILQYTGGTTGVPKGVSLTHSAVATNVSQREALLPTRKRQERVM